MNTRTPLLLTAPGLLFGQMLCAQDGVPDLDWGYWGRAQTYLCNVCPPHSQGGIAFDAQDRVVISGEWAFAAWFTDVYAVRYTVEGEVDSAFGENGVAHGYFCTSDDDVYDMDFGPEGSIYVCGREA